MNLKRVVGIAGTRGRKRLATLALGVVALSGGATMMAPQAALAAENCNSYGGGEFTPPSHLVCIGAAPNRGYNATLQLTRFGERGTWDFHLICATQTFGDDGPFFAEPNSTHTYIFAVGSQGTCVVEASIGRNSYFSKSFAS